MSADTRPGGGATEAEATRKDPWAEVAEWVNPKMRTSRDVVDLRAQALVMDAPNQDDLAAYLRLELARASLRECRVLYGPSAVDAEQRSFSLLEGRLISVEEAKISDVGDPDRRVAQAKINVGKRLNKMLSKT